MTQKVLARQQQVIKYRLYSILCAFKVYTEICFNYTLKGLLVFPNKISDSWPWTSNSHLLHSHTQAFRIYIDKMNQLCQSNHNPERFQVPRACAHKS